MNSPPGHRLIFTHDRYPHAPDQGAHEMKLYTHLNFGGDCEKAFRYYEEHLDGRITMMLRVRDLPADVPGPPGSPDAVIHARMSVAGVELIGNDVPSNTFK